MRAGGPGHVPPRCDPRPALRGARDGVPGGAGRGPICAPSAEHAPSQNPGVENPASLPSAPAPGPPRRRRASPRGTGHTAVASVRAGLPSSETRSQRGAEGASASTCSGSPGSHSPSGSPSETAGVHAGRDPSAPAAGSPSARALADRPRPLRAPALPPRQARAPALYTSRRAPGLSPSYPAHAVRARDI